MERGERYLRVRKRMVWTRLRKEIKHPEPRKFRNLCCSTRLLPVALSSNNSWVEETDLQAKWSMSHICGLFPCEVGEGRNKGHMEFSCFSGIHTCPTIMTEAGSTIHFSNLHLLFLIFPSNFSLPEDLLVCFLL